MMNFSLPVEFQFPVFRFQFPSLEFSITSSIFQFSSLKFSIYRSDFQFPSLEFSIYRSFQVWVIPNLPIWDFSFQVWIFQFTGLRFQFPIWNFQFTSSIFQFTRLLPNFQSTGPVGTDFNFPNFNLPDDISISQNFNYRTRQHRFQFTRRYFNLPDNWKSR